MSRLQTLECSGYHTSLQQPSDAALTLQEHFSAVTSLSFTPEGDRLLTAGRDKVAILWDVTSHKKLATVPVYEAVEGEHAQQAAACFRKDGETAMKAC